MEEGRRGKTLLHWLHFHPITTYPRQPSRTTNKMPQIFTKCTHTRTQLTVTGMLNTLHETHLILFFLLRPLSLDIPPLFFPGKKLLHKLFWRQVCVLCPLVPKKITVCSFTANGRTKRTFNDTVHQSKIAFLEEQETQHYILCLVPHTISVSVWFFHHFGFFICYQITKQCCCLLWERFQVYQ